MPLIDKPEWINHGGAHLFGVDIDPTGERLATCGSDNRIRIWSMRPVLIEAAELDPAVPKLLATLADAQLPVNCVRFAPAGRMLAAGTDDFDALLYELREGRGSVAFGSSDGPSLENWRLKLQLRGHTSNVADVSWAPDSRRLATASVDAAVKIWDAHNGHCIRTLVGHVGFCKGVAWDPFDFFLASQGDREVIVWRLEDGEAVARITEPFASAPIVSFALRLAWSPDGQTLAAPNGFDNGMHIVPLIHRNTWAAHDISLVGHKGTVTSVRYNPNLYLPRRRQDSGGQADDDAAGGVAAVASIDKKFSLWHPSEDRPLMVGRKFFDHMINDLAWSADGRVLVAASHDGTVTCMVFAEGELGRQLPEAEVQALHAQLYGEPRLRSQRGTALTAAPDLLQLEARARADVEREERLNSRIGAAASASAAGAAAAPQAPRPAARATTPAAAAAVPPPPQAQANGAPAPRPPTAGAPAASGSATGVRAASPAKAPPAAAPAAATAPATAAPAAKDQEPPPARKRIALQPQPQGTSSQATGLGLGVGPGGAGPHPTRVAAGAASATTAGAAAAAATSAGGTRVATDTAGVAHLPAVLVPPEPVRPHISVLIHMQASVGGQQQVPLELQASNNVREPRQRPSAELVCMSGPRRQWYDALQGHVVALAGSSRIVAAATSQGDLIVYSTAGRRLFVPIRLGSPAAFMSVVPGSAQLMVLTADGTLRLWDMAAGEVLVETSVAPLLAGTTGAAATGPAALPPLRVAYAHMSSAGCPMVVLSNMHAYVHHSGLRCWMRVADDAFPASAYTSGLASSSTGELGRLQANAAQRRHPRDVIDAAAAAARPGAGSRADQALLENNMAAAAALHSPKEWRQWLITYARRLAADEDEARLRDLISELMGPLRWSPAGQHPPAAAAGGAGRVPGSEPALASSVVGRWQPSILGYDKRRLLREEVLKEVAKNRVYQQLVAEVLDQLRSIEGGAQQGAARGGGGGAAAGPGPGAAAGGLDGGPAYPHAGMPGLQPQPQPMVLG